MLGVLAARRGARRSHLLETYARATFASRRPRTLHRGMAAASGGGTFDSATALHTAPKNFDGAVKLYDDWAFSYDDTLRGWGYDAHVQTAALVGKLYTSSDLATIKLLDCGSGTGMVGEELARQGIAEVRIGTDCSAQSLTLAGQKSLHFKVVKEGTSHALCEPKLLCLNLSEIQAGDVASEKTAQNGHEFGSINCKGTSHESDNIFRGDVVLSETRFSRMGATFGSTEFPDIKVSCPQTPSLSGKINDTEGPCVLVRPCYTDLLVGNLDKPFEYFDDGSLDVVVCAGTTSYVTDYCNLFSEWCRILKSGGVAIFTFRRNIWDANHLECATVAKKLEEEGKWKMIHRSEPCSYMPKNTIAKEREKEIYYMAFASY